VGPGQGGADTAARAGYENGAGIPHPVYIPQNIRSMANRNCRAVSPGPAPYLCRPNNLI